MVDSLPIALLDDLAGPESGLAGRIAAATALRPDLEPVIEPIGELLVDPALDLILRLQSRDRVITGVGTIGAVGAALVMPIGPDAEEGVWQLAAATGAARLVANTVSLAPRYAHRNAGAMIPMPHDAIMSCCGRSGIDLDCEAMIESMVEDGHRRAALEAILSPDALFWQLQVSERGASEPVMSLGVVDTERQGLWLALGVPGGALLQSTTPTGVWRALCHTLALVPTATV